jgi:hypothetical protein
LMASAVIGMTRAIAPSITHSGWCRVQSEAAFELPTVPRHGRI